MDGLAFATVSHNSARCGLRRSAFGAPNLQERRFLFTMNTQLLRDTLETLKDVRAEVQGTVANSVVDELDEVIKELEDALHSRVLSIDPVDVLMFLAKVIVNLPEIADAIKHFMRK